MSIFLWRRLAAGRRAAACSAIAVFASDSRGPREEIGKLLEDFDKSAISRGTHEDCLFWVPRIAAGNRKTGKLAPDADDISVERFPRRLGSAGSVALALETRIRGALVTSA